MSKLTRKLVPTTYDDVIRSSWEPFANEITDNLYVKRLFIKHMEMYDEAFEGALTIDDNTIDFYWNQLCRMFPVKLHSKVEEKFNQLLSIHHPKIKSNQKKSNNVDSLTEENKKLMDVWTDDSFENWVNLLKSDEILSPIINAKGHYIGGKKGKHILAAWVIAARVKGKLSQDLTQKDMSRLSINQFPNLQIGERTFDLKKDDAFLQLINTFKSWS